MLVMSQTNCNLMAVSLSVLHDFLGESMLQVLSMIPKILTWLPLVITGVSVVESMLGSGLSGEEKKKAVLAWLREAGQQANLPWTDSAISTLSTLIDAVVGLFNFLGIFRKKEEVAPEEAAVQVSLADTVRPVVEAKVAAAVDVDPVLAQFLAK